MSVVGNILKYSDRWGWWNKNKNGTYASQENYKNTISLLSDKELTIDAGTIANLYAENPIASRLVDDFTLDVIKSGFDFYIDKDNDIKTKEEELASVFEKIYLQSLHSILQLQAVCGASLLVIETKGEAIDSELKLNGSIKEFKFRIYPPYNGNGGISLKSKFGFMREKITDDDLKDEDEVNFTYYELYKIGSLDTGAIKRIHKSRCILYRGKGAFVEDLPNSMLYKVSKNIIHHASYLATEFKTANRGNVTRVSLDNEKMINTGMFALFQKPTAKEMGAELKDMQKSMEVKFPQLAKAKNELLHSFGAEMRKAKNGDIVIGDDCIKVENQTILANDFSRQIAKEEDMIAIGSGIPFEILLGKHNGNFGNGGSGAENSYGIMYRNKVFAEQEVFAVILKEILILYFKLNGIISPNYFEIRMKSPYPETAIETAQREKLKAEVVSVKIQTLNTGIENPVIDAEKLASELDLTNILSEEDLEEWKKNKNSEHTEEEL